MTNTLCPTCNQELPTASDTFGSRVEAARVQLELTRQELAEALGYQRTSIVTRWETGQLEPAVIAIIEQVAMVLKVTPAWLLYGVRELDEIPEPVEPPIVTVTEDEVGDDFPDWSDSDDQVTEVPKQESPADIIRRIRAEGAATTAAILDIPEST